MRRLSTRLALSHAGVGLVAAVTTFVMARLLVPSLYDRSMAMMGPMMGGAVLPRAAVLDIVAAATALGALAGLAAALAVSTWSTRTIMRPLRAVSAGVHRIARGRFDQPVSAPREAELAALADDVNELGAELAATERRRLDLLGDVAHEMRTPLTVLDGYVEGLQDGIFEPGPRMFGELADELARLRRLSEDLSALSRAEEGQLVRDRNALDLGDVARATVERLRPQFADAAVDLVVRADSAPVTGDAVRLGQVVTNLLGNALVATGPGGHVTVTVAHEGDTVALSVADDGVGLPASELLRVFERFHRVPGAPRSSGSGVGLTIATTITEAHGGTLTADSPGPGLGATFTLRIPAATTRQ